MNWTKQPMTKSFITENFLLHSEFGARLYHGYAKNLPILDYHNHLPAEQIAKDHSFRSLTELWLAGDHYKWRAMRTLGIQEKFITGDTSDRDKFEQWAFAVPQTIRNPLYHWTHLELVRYFDTDELLAPSTAEKIFNNANARLKESTFSTQQLLRRMNVEVVCTSDDPGDSLEHHGVIAGGVAVFPTFRPDKAYAVDDPEQYRLYLKRLEACLNFEIRSFDDLLRALQNRIEYFQSHGCRLSDHGLENLYVPPDGSLNPELLLQKLMSGKRLTPDEVCCYRYSILIALCKIYHEKGWTQQFHLGALRNTNHRLLKKLGPDTGFDSIGDFPQASALASFLNELDRTNQLTKTILYNLNPSDNEVMATMTGNFNDGSVRGKIQFGAAWWFLDQKDGIEKHLNTLSNLGMLSCFIGMLTDSRSFMSFPRHEYFRRILCNLIGTDVDRGELPADEKWLGQIVSDICYHNANAFFGFER